VVLLLERDDVNPDAKDNGGRTALSRAAENGHKAVVALLLDGDTALTPTASAGIKRC
jgi:ankyrin repeat protein